MRRRAFVDFVAKCLHWDPERRLKPQNAMRHPFIVNGRRGKGASPLASSSTPRSLLSTRAKTISETPKKPTIGAPTPLTARVVTHRTGAGSSIPATPIGTPGLQALASSTSSTAHRPTYRTLPASTSISYHHSSRPLTNGYATASAKTS